MIYDCFTFFNELNLLELRLSELYSVVDRFVIVESSKTFQGKDKPYYFEENKQYFRKYLDKIIHLKITFDDDALSARSAQIGGNWAREEFQRNAIALGLKNASENDEIIISDVDEIIRSESLKDIINNRTKSEISVLEMPLFTFCVNRVSKARNRRLPIFNWFGPRIINFRYFKSAQIAREIKPFGSSRTYHTILGSLHTRLRNGIKLRNGIRLGMFNKVRIYTDTGWHFTSMGDWYNFRNKVNSYSHPENKEWPAFQDRESFKELTINGSDPYPTENLPSFIRDNPDRFYWA